MKNMTEFVFLSVFSAFCVLSAADKAPASAAKPPTIAEQIKDADKTLGKNFASYGTIYDTRFIEEALTKYRDILKANGITAAEKATVEVKIANALVELDRVKEAETGLLNAIKTRENEIATLEKALGEFYYRTGEYAKAEVLLLKYNHQLSVSCLLKTRGFSAAEDWMKKNDPNGLPGFYCQHDKPDLAIRYLQQSKDPKIRGSIGAVVNYYLGKQEYAKAFACIKQNAAPGKDTARFLGGLLNTYKYSNHFSVVRQDKALTKEIFALLFQSDPNAEKTFAARYIDFLYVDCGDIAKAKEWLAKLDPKEKTIRYAVMEAVLTGNKSAVQLAEEFKGKNRKEQAQNLALLAEAAAEFKNEKLTRELWSIREKMLAKPARPSVNCTFLADCPTDITGFLAHSYTKDPKNIGTLNRKFGPSLQFLLETDAASTERSVSAASSLKFTTFVTACNAQGVWFFCTMPVTKEQADNIRNCAGTIGGFEMYVAPGFDEPYHTFIIKCPPNETPGDGFMTQYDNEHFRRAMSTRKNEKLTFRVDDDKVLMLLFLDWTTCVNYVPQNGDFWEVEPIRWEGGGLSWGGSESVHNRSSFGRMVFANMTPANRTAIMRRLLFKAKTAYRNECSGVINGRNGYLEIWRDTQLGDPEFDREVIQPLKAKYDAYAARIKPDMTDDEVNTVYSEAFHFMFNTKFILERMRTDYLQDKMTKLE